MAGTTATGENGEIIGINNANLQTSAILSKIEKALRECGGSLADVTRTRIFVTDISQWEEIGRAHGEVFKDIRPVTTMVEVKALIHPQMLVEIEATAYVHSPLEDVK